MTSPTEPQRGERIPNHGYRGDGAPAIAQFPRTLTIALSREPGARGNSIARRAGRKLGWQVVDQELLDYLAREPDGDDELGQAARAWSERTLERITVDQLLRADAQSQSLGRMLLKLAARGEVLLLGRTAGFILPGASTLHVRIVAPLADRIAYLSQTLRLTAAEAEEQIRVREEHRKAFQRKHLSRSEPEVDAYDLVLNSSRLGEELCAEMIVEAIKAKLMTFHPAESDESEADEMQPA